MSGERVARDVLAVTDLKPVEVWAVGAPVLDDLFHGVVIDPTPGLARDLPTVLYAPSDRPHLTSMGMLMRRPIDLLRGQRESVNLILKPHPNACEQPGPWLDAWKASAAEAPNVYLCDDPSIPAAAYIGCATAMVSDATSAMLEFLALDRPLIRVINPERFRDETHYDAAGYEWTWPEMAHEVQDVELLLEAVLAVLGGDDPAAAARARCRDHLFGDLADGRAAERIAERIGAGG